MTAHANAAAPAAPQNLFGICARVAEDFGFNPLWLRLAFACSLILDPVLVIGAYFALGAIVLSSRLLFPDRNRGQAVSAPVATITTRRALVEEAPELPLAA